MLTTVYYWQSRLTLAGLIHIMDSSAISWLSETGLDNPIFTDQFDFMDYFDEELGAILGGEFESSLSPTNNTPPPSSTLIHIPSTNSISSSCISPPPAVAESHSTFSTIPDQAGRSTPIVLNFGNADSPENSDRHAKARPLNPDKEAADSEKLRSQASSLADSEELSKRPQNMKRTSRVRPPSQTYDHIVAERRRREQLSQHFLSLSSIIPGLKKTDKTSVLGDAIKYLQHLKERVKILEEQATKKSMESAVLVKKSKIMVDDDDQSQSFDDQPLPEIEARICDRQILIRIQCENQRGLLANLIGQVEKLNLTIVNTNVTSFGTLALEITIITKMEKEFDSTVNEVVKKLLATIKHAS